MLKQRFRNYEISAQDSNNYILSSVGVVSAIKKDGTPNETAGNETLTNIGFYNSIASAVKRMAQLEANERETLKEWLEEYRSVVAELDELLQP